MTKIKICGLFRPCDVQSVNEAKPDWCGFIINFPKSHRSLRVDQARVLRRSLDDAITPVGVFVDEPVETVAGLLREGVISIAQLHGQEEEAYIAALRAAAPGFPIWKAFQARSPEDVEAAHESSADLVLLDSGKGTGRPFDWSLLRGMERPFLLAGGLTPENLPEAIDKLRPYGVDLSSGVETEKRKDPEKIKAAVAAARKDGGPCPEDVLASTAGSICPKP